MICRALEVPAFASYPLRLPNAELMRRRLTQTTCNFAALTSQGPALFSIQYSGGAAMAERSELDDPLNLMRVMPSKEARVRCRTGNFSHAIFRRIAFLFQTELTQWTK